MKRVQWGFSTIGCPELSLKEASELGKKYGYPLVEVRVRGTDFAEKELLKQLAAEKRCFILGSSFRLISDSDEAREELKSCALLAAECGIPYIRAFGGCGYDEKPDFDPCERARKNLAFFDQLDLPAELILETHDYFSSSSRITALFASLGRKLPIIWDSFHTWNSGKESPAQTWEQLGETILDIHVKDGDSEKLALPGKGKYPLEELFALLKEKNYTGMVTCEHEKLWRPYLPELSEAFTALEPYRKNFENA